MTRSDRRRAVRYDIGIPAEVRYGSDVGEETLAVTTRDVSSGGAFFFADRAVPIGTGLEVRLKLPRAGDTATTGLYRAVIDVSGQVVRAEARGLAVCFDKTYRISTSERESETPGA